MAEQRIIENVKGTIIPALIILLPITALFGNAPADIALVLVTVCFIISTVNEWRQLVNSHFLQLSAIFWVWILICSSVSGFPLHSFQDSLSWIRLPLYAFALSQLLNRKNGTYLFYFIGAAIFGTLVELSFIFYEYSFARSELARLHGTFEKLIAGWYLSCFGLISIFWYFEKLKQEKYSIIAWALILIFTIMTSIGVLITGEIMTTLFFFGSFILYFLIRKSYSLKTLGLMAIGCIILIGVGFFVGSKDPLLQERLIHSISTRLPWMASSDYNLPWTTGIAMAIENPIFGVGPKNFNLYCLNLKQTGTLDAILHVQDCQWHPHNLWLQIASETGIPGLILFSLLATYLIYSAYQHSQARHWTTNVPLILTIVVFFPIQTYSQAFGQSKNFYVWTMLGFSLLMIRQNLKDQYNDKRL